MSCKNCEQHPEFLVLSDPRDPGPKEHRVCVLHLRRTLLGDWPDETGFTVAILRQYLDTQPDKKLQREYGPDILEHEYFNPEDDDDEDEPEVGPVTDD